MTLFEMDFDFFNYPFMSCDSNGNAFRYSSNQQERQTSAERIIRLRAFVVYDYGRWRSAVTNLHCPKASPCWIQRMCDRRSQFECKSPNDSIDFESVKMVVKMIAKLIAERSDSPLIGANTIETQTPSEETRTITHTVIKWIIGESSKGGCSMLSNFNSTMLAARHCRLADDESPIAPV